MNLQHTVASRIEFTCPYEVDAGLGTRAHIGMVVTSNDQTLSSEARAMLTLPGIALYESRLQSTRARNQPITFDALGRLAEQLEGALMQINSLRSSNVVALGCTSAAMVIGQTELERRIRAIHPGARTTDPYMAIQAALYALGSRKVGFLSPYPADVAAAMIGRIEAAGFAIPVAAAFHNETGMIGDDSPFVSPASIRAAVRKVAATARIDTVVIACTQMRAAPTIADLEQEAGVRIVSSNQALCWHALRLAGCDDVLPQWGQLFQLREAAGNGR